MRYLVTSHTCRRWLLLLLSLGLFVAATAASYPASARQEAVLQLTGFVNGRLRFPKIVLWSKPGGGPAGARKITEVRSGTLVKIVQVQRINGLNWALVTAYGLHDHANGWVPRILLRVN